MALFLYLGTTNGCLHLGVQNGRKDVITCFGSEDLWNDDNDNILSRWFLADWTNTCSTHGSLMLFRCMMSVYGLFCVLVCDTCQERREHLSETSTWGGREHIRNRARQ